MKNITVPHCFSSTSGPMNISHLLFTNRTIYNLLPMNRFVFSYISLEADCTSIDTAFVLSFQIHITILLGRSIG